MVYISEAVLAPEFFQAAFCAAVRTSLHHPSETGAVFLKPLPVCQGDLIEQAENRIDPYHLHGLPHNRYLFILSEKRHRKKRVVFGNTLS